MRKDERELLQTQYDEPPRRAGLSFIGWTQVTGYSIAIILIIALLILAWPYLGWWGPVIAVSLGATVTISIPAAALGLGLHFWQVNERKNFSTSLVKPTPENQYPAKWDKKSGDWKKPEPGPLPQKVPQNLTFTQHNADEVVRLLRDFMRQQQQGTIVEEEKSQGRQLALPAPAGIPALYDLTEAFRYVDIAPESIFLARADNGEPLTVNAHKELCHGVFNAIPGRGKTIVERGLASQLLHTGFTVTFLDLKFALVTEDGLDYRPLAKKMWNQPPMRIPVGSSVYEVPHIVRNEGDIEAVLHFLAYDEIELRLRMRDAGDFSFPTHFFFLDDMLAFMQQHPEAAEDLIRVLTLGRELRLKLFTAAQNFQNKETRLSGGAKSIFETAYFLGGDTFSGAKVLDIPERDLKEYMTRYQVNLGKGLTLLRNNAVAPTATLARVGMASNNAIYYHHGRADDFRLPPRSEAYTPLGGSVVVDADTSPPSAIRTTGPLQPLRRSSSALSPQLRAALDAYQRGFVTSRTLAHELNIGKTRGAELIKEMKARRLI